MTPLIAIVPSRGRPAAAQELIDTFQRTCTADTRLAIAVDGDDPTLQDYLEVGDKALHSRIVVEVCVAPAPSTMVHTLNKTAEAYAPTTQAVAFMGDDHRPRTVGWDTAYLDALREMGTGIVYGNDLLQGANIPTQVAMTANIIRALGHMAPPVLTHLYVDNYWRDLGNSVGRLRYLPDVVVEHMHPLAGKAPWDEGHMRVNNRNLYEADEAAYRAYANSGRMAADIAKVAAL